MFALVTAALVTAAVLVSGTILASADSAPGGLTVQGNNSAPSITGLVYKDANGDGVRQAGETGLGGVAVELWEGSTKLREATTAADGSFSFEEPNLTIYTVKDLGASGYYITGPSSRDVTLTEATPLGQVEFGEAPLAHIRGTTWLDANGNGLKDEGEVGAANIPIQLLSDVTTATSETAALTTTNAAGTYSFANLHPGEYIVQELEVEGMRPVWPASISIVLNPGDVLTIDFMNTSLAVITGTQWKDVNGDGSHQPEEPALAGVTVTLDGASAASAVTDANGRYAFDALEPGDYTVAQEVPDAMLATSPPSVDVNLAAGQSVTVDFLNTDSTYLVDPLAGDDAVLPRTGVNLKLLMIVALALVLVGAVTLGVGIWARRTRQN